MFLFSTTGVVIHPAQSSRMTSVSLHLLEDIGAAVALTSACRPKFLCAGLQVSFSQDSLEAGRVNHFSGAPSFVRSRRNGYRFNGRFVASTFIVDRLSKWQLFLKRHDFSASARRTSLTFSFNLKASFKQMVPTIECKFFRGPRVPRNDASTGNKWACSQKTRHRWGVPPKRLWRSS